MTTPTRPGFKESLKFWTRLGFISFGGPAGQVAIMHEFLVEKKQWISDKEFIHALNYCMILPGPEAQQLATYMGWILHGTTGALAAGILFILPSMFILWALSVVYVSFGNVPWIYAMFDGLKPAVIAIVILALIKIGKKSLHTPFHYLVALAAFVCIFFWNVPFPLILLGSVLVAGLSKKILPKFFENHPAAASEEASLKIEEKQIWLKQGKKVFKKSGAGLILWLLPFIIYYLFFPDLAFWNQLSLFFTKAAFVTFGGAYAVLPYVAQVSVEKYEWLTKLQMIDGLALGETTPGPLVMVLVFVGFMAGYNHFNSSILMGTAGLVTTTFFTFLPCFLFILVGAPLISRTQDNKAFKQILSLVTAAVVGVMLKLTIYLGMAVIFPQLPETDYVAIGWLMISFLAMYQFKIGMIPWIGISALFGLIWYLVVI